MIEFLWFMAGVFVGSLAGIFCIALVSADYSESEED